MNHSFQLNSFSLTYHISSHYRMGVFSVPHVRQSTERRPVPNQRGRWRFTVSLSLCLDTQTAAQYKSFTTSRPEYRSDLASWYSAVLFYIYLHHDSILFLTITFLGEVNKWTESSASGPYEPAKCFHPADWHQHPTAFVMSITDSFLCVEMVLSLPRAALSTHHLNALFVCRVLSTQTQGSRIRAEDSLASVSFLTMTKEER